MQKNDDRIAVYSRKSKFTGKGESIGNQVELSREYIRIHCGDAYAENMIVYEDEGFSGGNLNRPSFKKMMKDCRERTNSKPLWSTAWIGSAATSAIFRG
jgi:DNA invertase Pin-like site-specific DNA recombinase